MYRPMAEMRWRFAWFMRLSREDGRKEGGRPRRLPISTSAQKQLQQKHFVILCLSFSRYNIGYFCTEVCNDLGTNAMRCSDQKHMSLKVIQAVYAISGSLVRMKLSFGENEFSSSLLVLFCVICPYHYKPFS